MSAMKDLAFCSTTDVSTARWAGCWSHLQATRINGSWDLDKTPAAGQSACGAHRRSWRQGQGCGLTQHFRDIDKAVLARDIINRDCAVNARRGQIMDRVGPPDGVAVANVHVVDGHLEEAHHVGHAVDCPLARAVAGGGRVWQAEGAADEGRLSCGMGADDGNVDVVHGGGRVAGGRLEAGRSAFRPGGGLAARLTPVEGSEGTSPAGWRCLRWVGERGPSVSEDESRLLPEASSWVAAAGGGKW